MAGVLAAALSVAGGVWLADGPSSEETVDGEFVLGPADDNGSGSDAESIGVMLPNVDLIDIDGVAVRLDRYAGTPLVINVWFSTCPACRRELADFALVSAEFAGSVQFVGVDPFDSLEVMKQFAAERGVTYDLLRDPGLVFCDAVGVSGYPTTLFVSADGVVLRQVGEIDADSLRAAIEELF